MHKWTNEHGLRSAQRKEQISQGKAYKTTRLNFEDIADAQIEIAEADGQLSTVPTDIEVDGQYFGQMLKDKIANYARLGRPTIWVTRGAGRAARIEQEIAEAHADNIQILVLD